MGARTDRDTLPVDDGGDIMRMGALHLEGDHRPLVTGGPDQPQRVDLAQALLGVIDQIMLIYGYPRLSDRIDVVDGGTEPDRLDDRGRPGLEFVRGIAIG